MNSSGNPSFGRGAEVMVNHTSKTLTPPVRPESTVPILGMLDPGDESDSDDTLIEDRARKSRPEGIHPGEPQGESVAVAAEDPCGDAQAVSRAEPLVTSQEEDKDEEPPQEVDSHGQGPELHADIAARIDARIDEILATFAHLSITDDKAKGEDVRVPLPKATVTEAEAMRVPSSKVTMEVKSTVRPSPEVTMVDLEPATVPSREVTMAEPEPATCPSQEVTVVESWSSAGATEAHDEEMPEAMDTDEDIDGLKGLDAEGDVEMEDRQLNEEAFVCFLGERFQNGTLDPNALFPWRSGQARFVPDWQRHDELRLGVYRGRTWPLKPEQMVDPQVRELYWFFAKHQDLLELWTRELIVKHDVGWQEDFAGTDAALLLRTAGWVPKSALLNSQALACIHAARDEPPSDGKRDFFRRVVEQYPSMWTAIEFDPEAGDPRYQTILEDKEKGPFGTHDYRKGGTPSKTATPAKREDPSIGAFGDLYARDVAQKQKEREEHQQQDVSRTRSISHAAVGRQPSSAAALTVIDANASAVPPVPPSAHKEPIEVILYGYQSEHQYAAIKAYELISQGMVCEDYPREPDVQYMKYRSTPSDSRSRSLTLEERKKANVCAGGNCWIKVTFDSAEAAWKAIHFGSPLVIYDHWVFAEYYRRCGPARDRPIPVLHEYDGKPLTDAARLAKRRALSLESTFSQSSTKAVEEVTRSSSTLPRSFISHDDSRASDSPPTASSSTVSSATTTGFDVSATNTGMGSFRGSNISASPQLPPNARCTLIPEARRAVLIPAEMALLPQRSFTQRLTGVLPFADFWTGNLIGDYVPRLDNGDFDYNGASIYWRVCWWIDRIFRTDVCGLKDDE
ncbi:MAG: hypothetical protein M1833_006275 [Piccolia ochrophora]|nr:MAG: hypothetical protein M1833_006275 [Piccolia ochrophora]